jgi:hypothetical protein
MECASCAMAGKNRNTAAMTSEEDPKFLAQRLKAVLLRAQIGLPHGFSNRRSAIGHLGPHHSSTCSPADAPTHSMFLF